jgi:hypothetical protein
MSKKMYVYSTLAASMNYTKHGKGGGDLPVEEGNVFIAGGANIPDKYMRTPEGAVVTPVTEEDVELLRANPVFVLHEKNGFVEISDKKVDGEKAAANMEGRDQSAPLVDQDFEAKGQEAPVTSKDAPKPNGRRA